jgi:ribosome biogenesis protein Tsr3
MNDYILKASRLIGEIQQLSVLVNLQTEMGCQFEFRSHVAKVDFVMAPNKDTFENRHISNASEEIISSAFYIDVDGHWNSTELKQQKTLTKLLKIKRLLINALKEKGINYGKLDYTIETVEYKRYVI